MLNSEMHWLPKTKLGKWGCVLAIAGFAFMFLQYWIAMAFQISFHLPGPLVVLVILVGGALSTVSIIRKERAVLLFLASVTGLFGLMLVAGELLFPH